MTSKIKFEDYLAIESAGGPTWHPDGKHIAFTSNASGQYQIYSTEIAKRKIIARKQLTQEVDRCTNPLYLPDGTLLFTRDQGGNENFQFGLIDETGELHWITSDEGAKHMVDFITDTFLYLSANINDRSRFDIYRWKLPLLENEMELIYEPAEGLVQVSGSSEDDKQILLTQYFGNMDQHILLLDVNSKALTDLTVEICDNTPTRWEVIRWVNSENIVVLTDYNSDMRRIGILKTSKKFIPFNEINDQLDFDLETQFTYSKDSLWTYFVETKPPVNISYRFLPRYTALCLLRIFPLPGDPFRPGRPCGP